MASTVTPTGAPAWTRTAQVSDYFSGENFQDQDVVDPLTDASAEQMARMAADLTAVANVSPFCTITFTARDTAAEAPTVHACAMMTGIASVSFPNGVTTVFQTAFTYRGDQPPPGFPSVERLSDGYHRITFSDTYTDPYGVSGAFSIRQACGSAAHMPGAGATANFSVPVEIVSATVLDVRAINPHAGPPAPYLGRTVTVEVW